MNNNINYYMSLKYPIEIIVGENGYFAEIPLLEGCMTQAHTLEELVDMIQDSKKLWLEWALNNNISIPLPDEQDTILIPKMMKNLLKEKAALENKTLNEYITQRLEYLS
ncbi:type II toxin-antitoxin system HicB family antitoxin [candidate division KSB1 bacterium]|nr:type II toxin-antitoxin system HicB family antitoxin [candidate division KSB1 bacterium]MBL7093062.1 type II toxin-antitoxin system HicB family antitoxin [candidate division KSB1 bacterium]